MTDPEIPAGEVVAEHDDLADLAEHDDIPVGDDQPGQDPPTDEPAEG